MGQRRFSGRPTIPICEMARALIAAGAAVNTPNHYGITPLLQASRSGDAPLIAALLKAGADPAATHPDGETPLMAASRTGRVDAVRLLLVAGANVNAAEAYQQQTALMWAAAEGHADVVKALLEAGADPNRKGHINALEDRKHADHATGGFTALMFAVRNGHEEVARALIKGGADPNLTNGDGATAMMVAIVNDRFDLASQLLDLGADPNDGSLYFAVDMHDATTDMRARDGSRLRANHPNKLTVAGPRHAAAGSRGRSEQGVRRPAALHVVLLRRRHQRLAVLSRRSGFRRRGAEVDDRARRQDRVEPERGQEGRARQAAPRPAAA